MAVKRRAPLLSVVAHHALASCDLQMTYLICCVNLFLKAVVTRTSAGSTRLRSFAQ